MYVYAGCKYQRLIGGTAAVTHHAEATINIYHKLALKCSISLPRIGSSVAAAKLISHSVELSLFVTQRVKFEMSK